MDTLWATDFFTKDVWTGFGKVTYYVLFFIHVGTRRVHICTPTYQPNGPWGEQQARNLVYELAERGEEASYLIKDGDTKFTVSGAWSTSIRSVQIRAWWRDAGRSDQE